MVGLNEEQRGKEMLGSQDSSPDIIVFVLKEQKGIKADDCVEFASLDK